MVAVVVLALLIALCVSTLCVVHGIDTTCSSDYGVAKSIQKEMLVERLL